MPSENTCSHGSGIGAEGDGGWGDQTSVVLRCAETGRRGCGNRFDLETDRAAGLGETLAVGDFGGEAVGASGGIGPAVAVGGAVVSLLRSVVPL
ncbi:hypothetical protein ACO0LE_16155 [Undibacterium sp. Xuan67W]